MSRSLKQFLCFIFVTSGLHAAYDPDMLWLSWKTDPTTTMVIQWADQKTDPHKSIEYRLFDQQNWETAQTEATPMPGMPDILIHRVELSKLKPDSIYQFRIGADGKEFKFQTMPDTLAKPISFVEGGDLYHDDLETLEEMSRVAASLQPRFAVIGGDIAYSCGSKIRGEDCNRWAAWLKSWKKTMITTDGLVIPVIAAIGNHEVVNSFGQTRDEAKLFHATFPLPDNRAYRTLDFGNYLSLFLLDSGHTAATTGPQQQWLNDALQARINRPMKFAVYHVPAYPSIRHYDNRDSRNVRYAWVPLFDKYGVNVAFEHHDHAYKRTYRMKNNRPDPNGTLYMGDGSWGIKKPRTSGRHRRYIANFRSVRHVLLVTLEKNGYTIQAIDNEGRTFDKITTPLPQLMEQIGQTPAPASSSHLLPACLK